MTRRIAHHIRVRRQLNVRTSYGPHQEPTCHAAVEPRNPAGRPRRSPSRWQLLFPAERPARHLSILAALGAIAVIAGGCGASGRPRSNQSASLHVRSSITDGAVLTDPTAWTAQAVGLPTHDTVKAVEFIIDGGVRWVEHTPPYFFNEDHNHLYPWVLGAGQHRLGVRLTTAAGNSASTSAEVTVTARQQPAALAGTYTRSVTATDVARTQSFRTEPASQALPAGPWRLHLERDGVLRYDDPQGGGGSEAFTALANGTLSMQGPVNWLEPASRRSSFCGVEPAGAYRWRTSEHTLVLTVRNDRCADRNSMFTGTWKRA